ncbi:preprotein translocase subunit SecE [candidate division WWE3 bacterium RIFCSPHIGHO2_01_FULL_40_23]|uniref:Protein translocase subunit SecE n=1 Tax=candidate division WWE3 bacterium RIFCSPLOWO2_01_FULL_41_18 TaxID=1802625 RepID=A0A1F4VE83_UNCKA|nr:MAG: preprotein translocase subunit SecE [candidate division WWE3 bacterium RIFCSPHIGHO2_01_FULL_40_23]OGC55562.1 MAG: preprotein translocase subunit SecE [candidate division WWE3 bacterium RIFCSPLOWO2_01_FULL_41_18]
MLSFFKEAYYELTKVNWPDKKQTVRLTQYVIGVSLVVGIYVAILDAVFGLGLERFIIR